MKGEMGRLRGRETEGSGGGRRENGSDIAWKENKIMKLTNYKEPPEE